MDPKQHATQLMGEYIKRKRTDFNRFQESLGMEMGYNLASAKQAVSQIERGLAWPPKQRITKLAHTLGLDANWLTQMDFLMQMKQYDTVVHQLGAKLKEEYGIEPLAPAPEAPPTGHLLAHTNPYGMPILVPMTSAPDAHAAPPAPVAITEAELEDKLVKMKNLLDRGLIGPEEYELGKRRLLEAWLP